MLLPPDDVDFRPERGNPLADVPRGFVNTTCPKCGGPARRETDTLAQWLCSCWYFLRYVNPRLTPSSLSTRPTSTRGCPWTSTSAASSTPCCTCSTRASSSRSCTTPAAVGFREPFDALFTQGMICKRSDKDGQLYKMSKSKGNVVSPDELIAKYGADTLRLYTLFIGPPEKDAEWSDSGIEGAWRFLTKYWEILAGNASRIAGVAAYSGSGEELSGADRIVNRRTHQTIKKVTSDILDSWHFNTAVAALMEFMNDVKEHEAEVSPAVMRLALESATQCLSPFVPHIAEEAWEILGHEPSIFRTPWPKYDETAAKADEIEIPVQVNGKLRGKVVVPAGATEDEVRTAALADERVQKSFDGKSVRKVIFVPGRLVNIVVG